MSQAKTTSFTEVEALGRWYTVYEIRYGEVTGDSFTTDGRITAATVHGLFEHPDFVPRLLGPDVTPVLERTYERLADAVEEHLDTARLRSRLWLSTNPVESALTSRRSCSEMSLRRARSGALGE